MPHFPLITGKYQSRVNLVRALTPFYRTNVALTGQTTPDFVDDLRVYDRALFTDEIQSFMTWEVDLRSNH